MSAFSYIIFVVVALMAVSLGAVGAYFYYRARHREAVAELEALDQDLAEREEELHRLQYQFTNTYPGGPSNVQTEAQVEMQQLQEELEQKKNDYNILKQDFDLEIGILKQELDQLREEKSSVEHTRRHLARKDAELEERSANLERRTTDLDQREEILAEQSNRLDAEIAARKKRLEDDFADRTQNVEEALAQRDRQVRAREISLEEEREELDRQRSELRDKQAKLDEELLELPVDKFTSRQEAVLIKRLRQQIKLQRDELEHLQRLYHKSSAELKALSGDEEPNQPDDTGGSLNTEMEDGRGGDLGTPAAARTENNAFTQDQGDSFPAYSTLSSYVDRGGTSSLRTDAYDLEARATGSGPERHDDLTSLPGINSQLQRALNQIGITSFDQIARWSSADVRRISERLDIDRKTIQDHWIINAQSHLFSRKAE